MQKTANCIQWDNCGKLHDEDCEEHWILWTGTFKGGMLEKQTRKEKVKFTLEQAMKARTDIRGINLIFV